MSLPRLGRLLYLDSPVRQPDGAGGYTESWIALGALWAEVLLRSGREGVQGGAPVSAVTYKITVRSAPMGHPERPIAGQRFRDGSRMFHIRAVAERAGHGSFLVCFVDEEVVA
jgi:head-tail adaptor